MSKLFPDLKKPETIPLQKKLEIPEKFKVQYKRTKTVYTIFLVLALLVIIDITTKPLLGFGIFAAVLGIIFGIVLPDSAVQTIVGLNHSLGFIFYLIIAAVMKRQLKSIEKQAKN